MYDKINYPKIHYQFYRKGNKGGINLNNNQLNKQQGKKMNNQMHNQINKRANSPMMNKNLVNKNCAVLKRKRAIKKRALLGGLVIRAGLGYLYPKDVEVLYGMLLANKKLISMQPERVETCREIGNGLRKL